jgi:hypothetical protein
MDRVLCAVIPEKAHSEDFLDEQDLWMDLDYIVDRQINEKYYFIVPLIDHPHNDKENGQKEIHYHADTRYFGKQEHLKNYRLNTNIRITKNEFQLEYFYLKKHRKQIGAITNTSLIKNSKLKHKCIHKGKCPHRGYDLSNEIADKDGIITCPLHGLKFDKFSKKLINDPTIK